ncbi:MAG: sigma 54-interacting transcriptional regulator [Bacteroidota bacterium]
MTVLLTFTGLTDPYISPSLAKPGPILTLLGQRSFDVIYLLSTPGTNQETRETKAEIVRRYPESRIVLVSTGLEDPTDYVAIQSVLLSKLQLAASRHAGAEFWAFVTPGTPQINAVWLSIGDRIDMPLRLLEVRRSSTSASSSSSSVSAERPEVREIRFRGPSPGPRIARSTGPPVQEAEPRFLRKLFSLAPKESYAPPESEDEASAPPAPAEQTEDRQKAARPTRPKPSRQTDDVQKFARAKPGPPEEDEDSVLFSRAARSSHSRQSIDPEVFAEALESAYLVSESRTIEAREEYSLETPTSGSLPAYLAVAKEVGIIGEEPCVREMLYTAFRCALRSIPVLITGETGTGKDLLARYIHRLSPRSEQASIVMNCAAITDTLAESELFGVKKGAYTGAVADREGKFGAADGGTLFLDEIGDLPLEIQAKLLRALENHEIQRVGDARTTRVDVRIIAATNKDLHELVKERLFRDDLLSRLSVGTIHVPPLRDRRSDIPIIAQYLLDLANQNEGVAKHFTPEALQLLTSSSWERWNIRELRTAIERAWTMAESAAIEHHHFKILETQAADSAAFPLPDLHIGFNWQTYLDELRDHVFTKALEMSGGNASAAARLLGVSPQAVSQYQQNRDAAGTA